MGEVIYRIRWLPEADGGVWIVVDCIWTAPRLSKSGSENGGR